MLIPQGLNNRWNPWSENQSINRWQSMPCWSTGIDWHRPIDDQSIISQKLSKLIDCHRLALRNPGIPHVPACTCTYTHFAVRTNVWDLNSFTNWLIIDETDNHKNPERRFFIDYRCQSINWHRLSSIDWLIFRSSASSIVQALNPPMEFHGSSVEVHGVYILQ